MQQINGTPINEAYRYYPDMVTTQDIQDNLDRLADIEGVLINNTELWSDMTPQSLEEELVRMDSWQQQFPGYTPEELDEEFEKQGRFIADLKDKVEDHFGRLLTDDPDKILDFVFNMIDEFVELKSQISELSEKYCK